MELSRKKAAGWLNSALGRRLSETGARCSLVHNSSAGCALFRTDSKEAASSVAMRRMISVAKSVTPTGSWLNTVAFVVPNFVSPRRHVADARTLRAERTGNTHSDFRSRHFRSLCCATELQTTRANLLCNRAARNEPTVEDHAWFVRWLLQCALDSFNDAPEATARIKRQD